MIVRSKVWPLLRTPDIVTVIGTWSVSSSAVKTMPIEPGFETVMLTGPAEERLLAGTLAVRMVSLT